MIIPLVPAKKHLEELNRAGYSDRKIGEYIGMARENVWRLRNGKHQTTSHEYGIRIANLHAQVVLTRQQDNGTARRQVAGKE